MAKINALFQDEHNARGEALIAAGMDTEDAHEALTSGRMNTPTHPDFDIEAATAARDALELELDAAGEGYMRACRSAKTGDNIDCIKAINAAITQLQLARSSARKSYFATRADDFCEPNEAAYAHLTKARDALKSCEAE